MADDDDFSGGGDFGGTADDNYSGGGDFGSGRSAGGYSSGGEYRETSHRSWLESIGESFQGVMIGLLLFGLSFPLLFWNEGRAVRSAEALGEGAGTVVELPNDAVEPNNEGKLVHLSGTATATETLTDPDFGISAKALKLTRSVEMYQWQQTSRTETRKDNFGGGQTRTTYYEYETNWYPKLINSDLFNERGKQNFFRESGVKITNPKKFPYPEQFVQAKNVTLGAFELPATLVAKVGGEEPFEVLAESKPKTPPGVGVADGGLYAGKTPHDPEVGDERITFKITKPTAVSVIGRQTGKTLQPYQTKSGDPIELLVLGNQSAAQMLQAEEEKNANITWLLRLVGCIMMVVGIYFVLSPLVAVADVIGFLGGLLDFGVSAIAVVVGCCLSLVTVSIAWVYYRPIIGVPLLLLGGGGLIGLFIVARRRPRRVARYR